MKSSASTKSEPDCSGLPSPGSQQAGDLHRQIKEKARALGFDLVGIASAQPPPHPQEFQQWLASGFHGEMGYMAKNAEKRVDPSRILADVRSVVVVGLNYNASDSESAVPSQKRGEGRIARDAWGACDYHDVMSEKLKQLASAIDGCGGPGTRSLWYVDTGPILERDLAQRAGIGFIGKHTNLIGNWATGFSWVRC